MEKGQPSYFGMERVKGKGSSGGGKIKVFTRTFPSRTFFKV